MARRGMCLLARRDRPRTRVLRAELEGAALWLMSCARRMWRVSGGGGLVKSFARMEGSRGTECSIDELTLMLQRIDGQIHTSMTVLSLY